MFNVIRWQKVLYSFAELSFLVEAGLALHFGRTVEATWMLYTAVAWLLFVLFFKSKTRYVILANVALLLLAFVLDFVLVKVSLEKSITFLLGSLMSLLLVSCARKFIRSFLESIYTMDAHRNPEKYVWIQEEMVLNIKTGRLEADNRLVPPIFWEDTV